MSYDPKYPWRPRYSRDHCPACFEHFQLGKCDNCGMGHANYRPLQPESISTKIKGLQAENTRLQQELRYEKMNTEVWRHDAEGKLADRTAAYHEIATLQKQVTLLREALKVAENRTSSPHTLMVIREALAATEQKGGKT